MGLSISKEGAVKLEERGPSGTRRSALLRLFGSSFSFAYDADRTVDHGGRVEMSLNPSETSFRLSVDCSMGKGELL